MVKKRTRKFPSIAAAAGGLKISESLIKEAKRRGCDAFQDRGSVDEKKLLAFIAEHGEELKTGGVTLRDDKLAEEIRKLRIKNDRDEGKLVAKQDIAIALQSCCAKQLAVLRQRLENEYPSAVAGLDVAQARVYGKRLVVEICKEMQALEAEWKF